VIFEMLGISWQIMQVWWWESARFQALCVSSNWFPQSGVVSSRPVVEPVETHQYD